VLQPRAELLQGFIADGVAERVVDVLEVVDVAQNQGQGASVTRRAVDLAWKVLAEEAPAGCARQLVRRRQLAVLLECDAQGRLELGDPPRNTDARVQLAVAHATPDALVSTRGKPRFTLRGVIQLRHVNDKGCAYPGARAQFADQLLAIGEHDRAKLRVEAAHGFQLVGDRFDLQHIGGDAPFHVLPQL